MSLTSAYKETGSIVGGIDEIIALLDDRQDADHVR